MVAACAAVEDEAFIAKSRAMNAEGLVQLERGLRRLGLEFIASRANFVTVRIGANAAAIYERLLRCGIIVRPIAGYGLPEHLRVTVGLADHNARLLAELERALAKG